MKEDFESFLGKFSQQRSQDGDRAKGEDQEGDGGRAGSADHERPDGPRSQLPTNRQRPTVWGRRTHRAVQRPRVDGRTQEILVVKIQ